jgi:hypothetical protein
MIEEGLTTALKASWAGAAVFPSQVPEGQAPPFISYREIDRDDKTIAFEIDACAVSGLDVNGYRQSKELAEAIRLALADGFAFDGGCVLEGKITKRSDEHDQIDPMHWTRAQYVLTFDINPY